MITLTCEHSQIRGRVVVNIAVDMMDDFTRQKLASKLVLHPHPMERRIASVLATVPDQIRVRAITINPKLDIATIANCAMDLFRRCPAIGARIFQTPPRRKLADRLNKDTSLPRYLRQRLACLDQAANLLPLLALD